jgi:hypothetical protein
MIHSHLRSLPLLVALVFPPFGCDDGFDDDSDSGLGSGPESAPWTRQFTFGSFAINSAPVVTNLSDFVYGDQLPDVAFEFFGVNVLLPSSSSEVGEVVSPSVQVRLTTGETLEIYRDHEYEQELDYGGETYSVYAIRGFTTDAVITPANFANVVFAFDAVYGSDYAAEWSVEVYKR